MPGAAIAQLGERQTEERSIPGLGIFAPADFHSIVVRCAGRLDDIFIKLAGWQDVVM